MKDNWKKRILGEDCDILIGGTPSRNNPLYWSTPNEDGLSWVAISDLKGKKYINTTSEKLSKLGAKNSNAKLIPAGVNLMSFKLSIGKQAITRTPIYTNEAIAAFIIKNNYLDTQFLYYMLPHINYAGVIDTAIKGATLNKAKLNKLTFQAPEISKQKKIAKILTTIDSIIEKTTQTIDKYKAIKKGMLGDFFTQGIDIITGNLRPKYKDAPEFYKKDSLGWIPKEWEIKKLKEVVEVKVSSVDKKIHPNKKLVRLCNYMDAYRNDFITDNLEFTIGSANTNELNRFELKKDDVIITKDSETPDDIAIPSVVVEDLNNIVCGYHLAILRPSKSSISGIFLMYNLKLPHVQNYFFRIASGSTRYGLTIGGIENVRIAVPKENEQKAISEKMMKIDSLITQEQKNLKKYQKIKKGLIQDLLSGKIEVKI